MSLVCFASFKGSPGTTITALAAAAAWPTPDNRRKLLLEADADGGTLALRYRLPTKPGLLSLAAATRHGLAPEQLWDHAQSLPGGLPVVLGPEGPEQATEVLRSNGRELGQWLRSLPGVDVIADVGRLSLGSAAFELARSADAVLGVARPVAAQLQPAAQRLTALGPYGPRVGWVLIGDKPYSAEAVTEAYGLPVVHVVAEDRRGASLMESGSNPKKLRRTTLVRSVTGLSEALVEWLHPLVDDEWTPPATPEPDPAPAPPAAQPPAAQPPAAPPPVAPPPAAQTPVAQPPVASPPVAQPPAAQTPIAQPPVAPSPAAPPPIASPRLAQPSVETSALQSPVVASTPTTRSTEVPPLTPAAEPAEPTSIPAPDPDARRPPSLAIIAARRGRDLAGVESDENGVEPHRNGTT